MAEMQLTKTRILAGIWEGVLTGAEGMPDIEVTHLARPVEGASLREDPEQAGRFLVRVPIPVELLSEGVQTFVITDKSTDEKLASFTVVTGEPLDEDLRAEMALIREELDLLKRAFRRHSRDSM